MVGIGIVLGLSDAVAMLMFPMRQASQFSAPWGNIVAFGTLILLYFLPLILVWRGVNWARWAMITLSVLGIIADFAPDNSMVLPPIRQFMNWLYAPYYLALIVFLLTPQMREHFAGKANDNAR